MGSKKRAAAATALGACRGPRLWVGLAILGSLGCAESADVSSPTDSGTAPCPYPEAPYGIAVGDRLSPSLAWEGFPADQPEASAVAVSSYFDCDGAVGVSALLFVQVILPCPACQNLATSLLDELPADWRERGIRIAMLVALDQDRAPATLEATRTWRDTLDVGFVDVLADPNFTFGETGATGLPVQVIVDPRTMQIVDIESGHSGDYSVLDSVSRDNLAAP